jgi:hypothetical protein
MSRSEIRCFSCPILSNIAINIVLLVAHTDRYSRANTSAGTPQNRLTEKGSSKEIVIRTDF